MPDEQVTTASAGPAQRRPRQGPAARALASASGPDLDERERNISPRRKAMGPAVPAEAEPVAVALAPPSRPEEPPTDPR